MIALCKNFGWTRVGTVSDVGEVYSATMALFRTKAKANGIAITSINSLTEGGDSAAVVRSLADAGTRITVVQAGPATLRNLLCSAYRGGMVGREYAWLLPGTWTAQWWLPVAGQWSSTTPSGQKPCNATEMTLAASGYVSVNSLKSTSDSTAVLSSIFVCVL
jgi:gamma-aminobutyric acid type B receptor